MDILDTSTPRAMSHEIAEVIDRIRDADFYPALFTFLSKYIPFNTGHAMMFFSENGAPVVLHDGSPNKYEWIDEYASGYYLLDPVWIKLMDPDYRDSFYILDNLAPDSFKDSSYYERHYRKADITDEFGWIARLENGDQVVICLMRRWDAPKFVDDHVRIANILYPIFSRLIILHETLKSERQMRTLSTMPSARLTPSASINKYLKASGNEKQTLSDRQSDIVDLILQGHSTESIGLNLEISAGTVKTHKRNIYSRLGISSHGELFNLFVTSLKEG
ncbi:helix-turn-helix transcriptional regulator [Shinella pollutisoli]|uniref:Helix-turn-helix transcriptional regulator n=1 Tax=Shinella pollutisoli TaxID=2250594 RepID=A0ABV7DHH7_9HYPH|nr:LuxR family transcriptional regulator [Shinella pollutisoli]